MNLREVEFPDVEDAEGVAVRVIKWIGVLALLAFGGFVVLVLLSFEPEDPRKLEQAALELEKEPSSLDDHQELRFAFNTPPIAEPHMQAIDAEQAVADKRVIGIAVADVAHAYVIRKPKYQDLLLISTRIGGTRIAITHNYLLDKTRVFAAGGDADELLDLRIGGQDNRKQMVLLLDDVRYVQESEKIPLQDYPFEVTTLEKWYQVHPQTLVNFDEETRE